MESHIAQNMPPVRRVVSSARRALSSTRRRLTLNICIACLAGIVLCSVMPGHALADEIPDYPLRDRRPDREFVLRRPVEATTFTSVFRLPRTHAERHATNERGAAHSAQTANTVPPFTAAPVNTTRLRWRLR